MNRLVFSSMNLNPDAFFEKPDPTRLIDTTGYEKIGKTVDRLMVAGLNLYMVNRNGDYQVENPDDLDNIAPAPSKYFNEMDVKMRLREIQKRLRSKVHSQISEPGEIKESEEPEVIKPTDVVKET